MKRLKPGTVIMFNKDSGICGDIAVITGNGSTYKMLKSRFLDDVGQQYSMSFWYERPGQFDVIFNYKTILKELL